VAEKSRGRIRWCRGQRCQQRRRRGGRRRLRRHEDKTTA